MAAQSKRLASFAISRAALNALLHAQADAVTIGAYLKLAQHTDKSGQFSTASFHGIKEALSIDRLRAEKAIAALCRYRVAVPDALPLAQSAIPAAPPSKPKAVPPHKEVPLLYTREAWLKEMGGELPDGPGEKSLVRFVLPTFNEPEKERVWIGSDLVLKNSVMDNPLQSLKDCGNVAARLLLTMYAHQDLTRWWGVSPNIMRRDYFFQQESYGGLTVIHAVPFTHTGIQSQLLGGKDNDVFLALERLEARGFVYEAPCLLNRSISDIGGKWVGQDEEWFKPDGFPSDADVLCDLGTPSPYGPVSDSERGLGPLYAKTIQEDLRERLASEQGNVSHTLKLGGYVVLLPTGWGGMVAGLYRLRFRMRDTSNPFITESTRGQLDANKQALKVLNHLRKRERIGECPPLQS